MFQRGHFKGREVQILKLPRTGILAKLSVFKVLFGQESQFRVSRKAEVVDEQRWTGSSGRGGGVMVCEHIYIYIYMGLYFFTGAGQEGLSTGYDSQV